MTGSKANLKFLGVWNGLPAWESSSYTGA